MKRNDERSGLSSLLAPMWLHPSEDPDTEEGFIRDYPPRVIVLINEPAQLFVRDMREVPVRREWHPQDLREHPSRIIVFNNVLFST